MSSEKTEQPTPHKLREARKNGQVAKSKDFTQTLLVGALFVYTLMDSERLLGRMIKLIELPADLGYAEFNASLSSVVTAMTVEMVFILLPYILIVIIVGIFAETIQIGLLVSFKVLMPKGERLNPVSNLKQMFSMKSIVEFLKSNIKVMFLTAVIFFIIRSSIDDLVKIPPAGLAAAGVALAAMLKKLIIFTFIAFSAIALFDLLYQRFEHRKSLRMSIEEIKQEYKQLEGNPEIKGHRKQLAKEIAMNDSNNKTRKATVVVSNPTHLAISLFFDAEETPLPIVLNKGRGVIAHEIMRIAREAGVPIMQNIPLARRLMADAVVDHYIPSDLVEPVAEVLIALRRLAQQREEGTW
ncbi:type III secretion system export apparatus subunit SctU [Noviherbaspirillum suwonense]|jgi:type III secretion protein U|uniref:Type III secretion protein U n=1 Tax=Noviherbaspirillum suwonense TaxID=1224511 RepID=A0ABY1PS85_9BURK|nr:type III secretion system export apparatus subunit SctU [Noviherbaspirillum suwonense]SMP44870.1 type III secretion protein U [Noviherbaspirillum suwonense]